VIPLALSKMNSNSSERLARHPITVVRAQGWQRDDCDGRGPGAQSLLAVLHVAMPELLCTNSQGAPRGGSGYARRIARERTCWPAR
jgi:hypothetical protein